MEEPLKKTDVQRYSRQLLVQGFGVKGQKKLSTSKVLIVGAGGLGCPVALYLAGAGVGTIGIVDFDAVSIDNLHRQIGHQESSAGQPKVESLKDTITRLNSTITVKTFRGVLNGKYAQEIVPEFDVVADCSDNPATRYLVNDICVLLNKPLVSGSALRWEGQLTIYHSGDNCPCYRCIFPHPPAAHLVTNCSEGGVMGPVVGVIGSMQALEIIKLISDSTETLAGKLLIYDGQAARDHPTITEPIDYETFCGSGVVDKTPSLTVLAPEERVTVQQYAEIRKEHPLLIDTRPPHEFAIVSLPEAKNLPLDLMQHAANDELEKLIDCPEKTDVILICHRGNDSQLAVRLLKDRLKERVDAGSLCFRDVIGGYQQWAEEVDAEFPTY
ncbi:unnamed protein product, partial [Mesorhabditis spiculigera]